MDFFLPILNTLAIAVALILLMVGLMSAPWQVLLVILLLGILTYQWLVRRDHLEGVLADVNADMAKQLATASDRSSAPFETDAETLAKATESSAELSVDSSVDPVLHYRGATYIPPALSKALPTIVEITGRYRGGVHKSSVRMIEAKTARATSANLPPDHLKNR